AIARASLMVSSVLDTKYNAQTRPCRRYEPVLFDDAEGVDLAEAAGTARRVGTRRWQQAKIAAADARQHDFIGPRRDLLALERHDIAGRSTGNMHNTAGYRAELARVFLLSKAQELIFRNRGPFRGVHQKFHRRLQLRFAVSSVDM